MKRVGRYDIEDPQKIQGRDEVGAGDRSLAALRLRRCLDALCGIKGRLLLLGCGAGRYLRALERERPGLVLHGGDLSLTALREARSRDSVGSYTTLDSSELPYRDNTFSAVVFFDLLEHVPDHHRMLMEIERVLVPAGKLHFFVPLEGKPGTLYSLFGGSQHVPIHRWKQDHVGHIHRFEPTSVVHDVWDTGLSVEDVSYSFHLAGQIHDIVDYWRRERLAGGGGIIPIPAVRVLARLIFILTWRLAYVEDQLYSGRRFASGLHLTAYKPLVDQDYASISCS
jgi:SAM-dependent methyltransferase